MGRELILIGKGHLKLQDWEHLEQEPYKLCILWAALVGKHDWAGLHKDDF